MRLMREELVDLRKRMGLEKLDAHALSSTCGKNSRIFDPKNLMFWPKNAKNVNLLNESSFKGFGLYFLSALLV